MSTLVEYIKGQQSREGSRVGPDTEEKFDSKKSLFAFFDSVLERIPRDYEQHGEIMSDGTTHGGEMMQFIVYGTDSPHVSRNLDDILMNEIDDPTRRSEVKALINEYLDLRKPQIEQLRDKLKPKIESDIQKAELRSQQFRSEHNLPSRRPR